MTNETILAILDHLCNEARNSAHATFGVMDLLRDSLMDSTMQASLALGTASADQLLRSIDDLRSLLSPIQAPAIEEFDLALCAGEIVEVLSLASGRRAKHMILDAPAEPLVLKQARKAVEQVLTRVLSTALKLAKNNEVYVKVRPGREEGAAQLTVSTRDTDLSVCLNIWLNAHPDQIVLQDPADVPFVIAVMVAGKYLKALGGSAEVVRDSAGHSLVVLDLPSQVPGLESEELQSSGREAAPDRLKVLVAEDCDDSFALSELLLQEEHVWRARDGWEALRIIQKQRFDVVFMDIHMPGMDGYSAIRSIRDWETETGNGRTPMVILSSDDLETQRRTAAQCGCSGFLRKPLRRRDLVYLLDRLKESRVPVD
ncbi:MAG TPA: response regulator [Bryobacteraceae bacterium]|jgi:CheY-like chemotaxis protein